MPLPSGIGFLTLEKIGEIVAASGVTGPPGATGPKGDQGDAGAQGVPGEDGLQGNAGEQGPAGPPGPAGNTGLQGSAGNDGAAGLQGDTGASGIAGATGATGPQGPIGDTGSQGATGPTGNAGAAGAQGPIGNTGPQGNAGAPGAQGNAGAAGAQGPQGVPGTPAPVPACYRLGAAHANSTVTPTTIGNAGGNVPWAHTLVANRTYRFTVIANHQTVALTTGGRMNLLGAGGLAGTVAGSMRGSVAQAAAATALEVPIHSFANGAGSFLLTTAVAPINAPHLWKGDFVFRCTTGGTLLLQWASEVAASAAQLNIGSVLIVEEIQAT